MIDSNRLTPELTGAGARSAKGTNIGHENGEAMANVGVRVERFVRLWRVGRVGQAHSRFVMFECPQKSGKRASQSMQPKQTTPSLNPQRAIGMAMRPKQASMLGVEYLTGRADL